MSRSPVYAPNRERMARFVVCPTCPENGILFAEDGRAHCCWDCKAKLDPAREHGNGYRSQTYDHLHVVEVDGKSAATAAFRELCLECYRIDFAKAYPGVACPV